MYLADWRASATVLASRLLALFAACLLSLLMAMFLCQFSADSQRKIKATTAGTGMSLPVSACSFTRQQQQQQQQRLLRAFYFILYLVFFFLFAFSFCLFYLHFMPLFFHCFVTSPHQQHLFLSFSLALSFSFLFTRINLTKFCICLLYANLLLYDSKCGLRLCVIRS